MRTLTGTHSNGFLSGTIDQFPNHLSFANAAYSGITASCSQGIITFSHSNTLPLGKNGHSIAGLNCDILIYSCFTSGTAYSSDYPSVSIINNQRSSYFDLPNKSMQNIYEYIPINASNKWRNTVAKGSPYETIDSESVAASGFTAGCSGFGPAYSTMNAYTSYNGVYDKRIYPMPVSNTNNTYTIDVNAINSLPGRASNPGWKFESPLCSGNARVYIRPYSYSKYIGAPGNTSYVYGNWSHFDVNISGSAIPNRVANAVPTNFTVSGRTVSWQTNSTCTSPYIYLYKNNSVVRFGYIQNNANGSIGFGDLAYTVPSGDGSGSFTLYVNNYSAVENGFSGYASTSFNL